MILTVKQQVKHLTKQEYITLRKLCKYSKNLVNQTLYEIRQEYFNNKKYLGYNKVYHLLKTSTNYKMLQSNMAEQIIKSVDYTFKSFFALLKKKDLKANIPHYLNKDGYAELIIQEIIITNGFLKIPYSRTFEKENAKIYIRIPSILDGKNIRQIKITPKYDARFFEILYSYETDDVEKKELDKNKALAIDLGVNNFCTCASSEGKAFIIDGHRLKSLNQWYNKENSRLRSIKDKQKSGKRITNRQAKLALKREAQIRDYIGKTARKIINYCFENDIGNLVLGKNNDFQDKSNIGNANNQNFVNMPYGKLRKKLEYLCKIYGIRFAIQEESYTSKASFWEKDFIPVYQKGIHHSLSEFSGRRIHRGLYRRNNGMCLNADVNGALNILRKSNVVSLEGLYSRGELSTPIRIRIA